MFVVLLHVNEFLMRPYNVVYTKDSYILCFVLVCKNRLLNGQSAWKTASSLVEIFK